VPSTETIRRLGGEMRAALRVSRWNAKTSAIGASMTQLSSMTVACGGGVSRFPIVSGPVVAQTPGVDDAVIGEAGVRASFARQGFMAHLGAELLEVGEGTCTISCRPRPELTQQHGFMHAGVVAAIADSAAGYAAMSLMAGAARC
jgi:hypothetical protein